MGKVIELRSGRELLDIAEQAVLSAAMQGAPDLDRALKQLRPEDFASAQRGRIWRAVRAVYERSAGVDPVTVADELDRQGELKAAGGREHLGALVDAAGTADNIAHHARIVVQHAQRRRLAEAFEQAAQLAREEQVSPVDLALRQADALARFVASATDGAGLLTLRCLADVEPQATEWLWPGHIPLGNITICDGNPGLGKSTLALEIAARVSRGRAMPDGRPCARGDVLLLSAEDSLAETMRTRLEAAGADLSRIYFQDAMLRDGQPLTFPEHVGVLEHALRQNRQIRMIVIDPLTAFLSRDANANIDQDVRWALTPVKDLAEKYSVAPFFIRHLNKSKGGAAIARGGGSMGLGGAARSVLLVSPDPDDPDRRVLATVKNNLAPHAPSLAFHIEEASVGPGIPIGRIVFDGTSRYRADDLVAALDEDAESRTARGDAEEWLRDYLADGLPKSVDPLKQAAQAAGHAPRTLGRAAKRLGIKRTRPVVPGPWFWELAPQKDRSAHSGQLTPVCKDGQYGQYGEYGDYGHHASEDES